MGLLFTVHEAAQGAFPPFIKTHTRGVVKEEGLHLII